MFYYSATLQKHDVLYCSLFHFVFILIFNNFHMFKLGSWIAKNSIVGSFYFIVCNSYMTIGSMTLIFYFFSHSFANAFCLYTYPNCFILVELWLNMLQDQMFCFLNGQRGTKLTWRDQTALIEIIQLNDWHFVWFGFVFGRYWLIPAQLNHKKQIKILFLTPLVPPYNLTFTLCIISLEFNTHLH